MKAKNTFRPRDAKGKLMPAVAYTPMIYIAGTQTHRFALHKSLNWAMPDEKKDWHVSEPETGMHVCTVTSDYKGLHMSSRGLSTPRAREAAMAVLDALCERIGSEKFNATLADTKAKLLNSNS